MAFTVADFEDLVHLLDENPSWVIRLRKILFDQAWEEVRQSIQRLSDQITRHEQETARRFAKVDTDIGELKTDVAILKTDVAILKTDVGVLKNDVGDQKGRQLESQFRERAASYFGQLLTNVTRVEPGNLPELHAAFRDGVVTDLEREWVLALDAVIRGTAQDSGEVTFLALEVSSVIDSGDVTRSLDRAAILRRIGLNARAAVGGSSLTQGAKVLIEANGVVVRLTPGAAR